ncbi:MAG TPA: hypothetical protein VEB42_02675, partial [Chitinophagaceae bacterium]|nr:hypothetical protein [Chitinophagaceae bacterium]
MNFFLNCIGVAAVVLSFSFHSCAQRNSAKKNSADTLLTIRKNLSDDQLLELVQKQTFRYFWDFAHPVSGLARERSNVTPEYGNETVTIGGSGFGIMSIIVAAERGWISRDTAAGHLLK